MKYTEALEVLRRDYRKYFTATYMGGGLQLWGDVHGCYVYSVEGLIDIGTPWFVLDLEWIEVSE